jgi:hypothetical protein
MKKIKWETPFIIIIAITQLFTIVAAVIQKEYNVVMQAITILMLSVMVYPTDEPK